MKRFVCMALAFAMAGAAAVWAAAAVPASRPAETRPDVATQAAAPEVVVDDNLPEYVPVKGISGTINSAGSSIVSNFLNRWGADFRRAYPDVRLNVTAGGSGLAIDPLVTGESQIAPMSREMNAEEIALFKKKYGYAPTRVIVAADALAIFVNKENPLETISLKQADAVFSSTLKRGGPSVDRWGGLGLTGEWKDRPIAVIVLGAESGSSAVFREIVMKNGAYKLNIEKDVVSSSVIQGVGADPAAIGFGSFVLRTKRARALGILGDDGTTIAPTQENVLSGKYPLTRFLSIYVNKPPGKDLPPATRELLRYILSKDGQSVLVAGGNMPLSQKIVAEQRKLIGD